MRHFDSLALAALGLAVLWVAASALMGAFLGFVGAIAWTVAKWLL